MTNRKPIQRSSLGLIVLWLLVEEPMHVYRMQKLIEAFGKDRVVNVRSRASLYQALERLMRHGLVEVRETVRSEGYPDRVVYAITDAGRETAEEWLREMLRTMHHGGSIAILGIPPEDTAIDWNQVIFKGLVIKGIYGREMFETWYKMSSMLQSGLDITPVITHHLPANDYRDAFETMKTGHSGKIILDWSK